MPSRRAAAVPQQQFHFESIHPRFFFFFKFIPTARRSTTMAQKYIATKLLKALSYAYSLSSHAPCGLWGCYFVTRRRRRPRNFVFRTTKAVVTTMIRLRSDCNSTAVRRPFDCSSTAIRPFDDLYATTTVGVRIMLMKFEEIQAVGGRPPRYAPAQACNGSAQRQP